ncbi:right-handed parallel beta-helix repeat-containing protein [Anaerobacillus sp. CMMVII]|uniref:right-handed parallel beta-helix repeat-containing protein n=1 Tax=Anaerobacillus sp. CMMVII TaxID=2755588 RepID=UPI0021B6F161|nr:NosD domain-containing protein [Anaerobacillus sp. CMMVII]MCT8139275.1 right-handed parallel beta-helix repeat-containing protein [Anaerobacillus sp. CMMVII]
MIMFYSWKIYLIFCLLFSSFYLCFSGSSSAHGTIQDLIDQAEHGEEIILPEGIYEEVITITKSLKIIGEGAIIKNTADKVAIHIQSDEVSLTGLTVFQLNKQTEHPAILIEGTDNTLSNLKISSQSTGVQLNNSIRNTIEGLHIEREQPLDLAQTNMGNRQGNGIDLFFSNENVLKGNTMVNQLDGIYVESSSGNIIENNHVIRSRYGYHLMFAESTTMQNNYASLNITGAMIMGSSNLTITNNTFTRQSYHVHSQGLLLYDVHDSTVSKNFLSENLIGLYIERSSQNFIQENQISANFVGIQLKRVSNHDIFHNDFNTNVIQARVTDSDMNDVRENYWDSHTGLDFTGDGKSEIQFQSDPIFLSLVERKPSFQVLAQSPGLLFLNLLFDMNEEAILKDTAPLLKPNLETVMDDKKSFEDLFIYLGLMLGSVAIILGGRRK